MNPSSSRSRRSRRGPSSNAGNSRSGGGSHYRGGANNRNNRSKGKRRGQYIDPSRFVKAAKHVEIKPYVPVNTFEDFDLDATFKRNLRENNFVVPSQIQDESIPVALKGHDVVGIANTGTGKTVAFLLPLMNKLLHTKGQKALIIAPTRELALQIQQESRKLGRGARLYDALIIGGAPFGRQARDLERQPQIIVGTPGRIKDHLEKGTLLLEDVKTIVLDEVDRMLDMGFVNDIRFILEYVPKERQSLFFSATMSPVIEDLIKTFTTNARKIMARTSETSDSVEQSVMTHSPENKADKLHDLLLEEHVQRTLVFCETKRSTEKLSKDLIARGFTADAMHGNKSQGQRERALRKFKSGDISILVATDVAARGIDVDDVTHVINYDIPQTYDDYTHRIGRTGRGGASGNAVTFVAEKTY